MCNLTSQSSIINSNTSNASVVKSSAVTAVHSLVVSYWATSHSRVPTSLTPDLPSLTSSRAFSSSQKCKMGDVVAVRTYVKE